MRRGWIVSIVVTAVVAVVALALVLRPSGSPTGSRADAGAAVEGAEPEGLGEAEGEGEGEEEEVRGLGEKAHELAEHHGVAVAADDQGSITAAEARGLAPLAPAPGWAGEIRLGAEDTWEPTIATDPSAPYVYAMYNRFGGPKACNNCPGTPVYVRISSDNGVSWGPEVYLCPCPKGKAQFDPVVKVASNGAVYATFMDGYDMMFTKSINHGATWTTPIEVSGKPWGDKPWIGVSANGTDVYIGYETASDVWVAASHNGGTSFAAPVKLNTDSGRYRYPNGFEVLPNGTALLSASSYPGSQSQIGAIDIEIWRSTNGGASWTRTILATPFSGVTWETSSTTALASDAAGNLVALYTGATALGGNGHVWTRRSTDGGATWTAAIEIGPGTANASFPAIAGGASGVFRLFYTDNRTGSWNTFYRSSTDGGQSWSAEADISDADTGATYKTAAGFASPYGDYGGMDVTNTGKTVAVWGEGASFSNGPGGIWFNRLL
jgi:hypothetical protein